LSTERCFNITKYSKPIGKDLKARWDEMKAIVDVDREEHEKTTLQS